MFCKYMYINICIYILCLFCCCLFSFQDVLEKCIETCTFPPPPVAICRLDQSADHQKAEMYYSDKDFKVTPILSRGNATKADFVVKTPHACL